jgi:hypothetical protein
LSSSWLHDIQRNRQNSRLYLPRLRIEVKDDMAEEAKKCGEFTSITLSLAQ